MYFHVQSLCSCPRNEQNRKTNHLQNRTLQCKRIYIYIYNVIVVFPAEVIARRRAVQTPISSMLAICVGSRSLGHFVLFAILESFGLVKSFARMGVIRHDVAFLNN